MNRKHNEPEEELLEEMAENEKARQEEQERIQKKADKQAKKFLKDVKTFLQEKNGGTIPSQWLMSLQLLDVYYRQFLQCSYEIESLPSLIVDSRYGPQPHPLLKVQASASVRLEKAMSELGLSLKAASKLEISKPVVEESPLDKFVKHKVEKRG